MEENFKKIKLVVGVTVNNVAFENESAILKFDDGGSIYAGYWRLIINGKVEVSSFDHNQKYGLRERIDAVAVLALALRNQKIIDVNLDLSTGDLDLKFANNTRLQIFNFTGNEVWEVTFADGTSILSNYLNL